MTSDAPPKLLELPLVIRTERLLLRPIGESDVDAIWSYCSDPEVSYFMTWETHRARSESRSFVGLVQKELEPGKGVVWGVVVGGALRGLGGIEGITPRILAWRAERAEIGFWIAKDHRNRGFVTEASRAALRFAFEDLRLHKVFTKHIAENVASRRVIEKLGFREVGVHREELHRHGRWWDLVSWELLEADWGRTR